MVLIQIIAPPEGSRHKPLTDQLDRLGLEYTFVPAHMLTEVPEGYDMQRAIAYNGAPLTPGEIGCAMSHVSAMRQLNEFDAIWSVILEDDARITDSQAFAGFVMMLDSRGDKFGTEAQVISLLSGQVLVDTRQSPLGWRCLAPPWFTVAYAINRRAAISLANTNSCYAFAADWPLAREVTFYRATQSFIAHGDGVSQSLIGERWAVPEKANFSFRNLSKALIEHRMAIYSGLHYLRYKTYFDSPAEYAFLILRRRLIHHAGRVISRLPHKSIFRFRVFLDSSSPGPQESLTEYKQVKP